MLILHFTMSSKSLFILSICLTLTSFCFPPGSADAYTDSAEADIIPWSGYWWPTSSGGLATGLRYRGHPAPIEKYELLKDGRYPGVATTWEMQNHYDPTAPGWYGLCHAWASAAVMEDIDFKPSSYENILFYVGDKKGLISACHGSDLKELASGSAVEVFHQWLLYYIKDNGLAFVADLAPSEEFWSYPIYKYSMEITESGSRQSVSCRIWYASDFVDPDFQGTEPLSEFYTYELYLDGDGEVTGGAWTGTSAYNHPGFMWRPIAQVSTNPHLDYGIIKEIAETRDDPFEGSGPVILPPGDYNLVLLDEDAYRILCSVGDTVLLTVEVIDDLADGVMLDIKDGTGASVFSAMVADKEELSLLAENPPYFVTVSKEDYGEGGTYAIVSDLETRYEFLIPWIQKGGAWLGWGLTNGGDYDCDHVNIVACRKGGRVMGTLMGPFSLPAGEKRTFQLSEFPIRKYEQADFYSIKILADTPLSVMSLNGNQNQRMSCFNGIKEGFKLVVPEITSSHNYTTQVWWGVYNKDGEEETVTMSLFSPEGSFVEDRSEVLPGNSSLNYSPSESPFQSNVEGGWVLIEGYDNARLEGYISWIKNRAGKGESLLALNKIGKRFFVPHMVYNNVWKTELTLINLTGLENVVSFILITEGVTQEATVILAPFEKMLIDVREVFPTASEELLARSFLQVEAVQEVTGFYAYETTSSLGYYPLLSEEDAADDLVVTHTAATQNWWTGVGIFNLSSDSVSVSVLPYGHDGMLVADQIRELILNGHEKNVFCVGTFFDASRVEEISFLKIHVDSGPGVAGLFMYGDTGYNVLSGAGMHRVE